MATYLSLEEAAQKLGIPTDRLIDLRSQGQVRGFRDGSSWKFPENEIDRLKDELPSLSGMGSGILASDAGGSKAGTVIGGDSELSIGDPIGDEESPLGNEEGSSIDLDLELPRNAGGSDVNLVAGDSGIGTDVKIVSEADSSGDSMLSLDDVNLSGDALLHESSALEISGPTPTPEAAEPVASDDSDEFNLGSSLDLVAESDDLTLGEAKAPGPVESSLSGLSIDSGVSGLSKLSDGSGGSGDLLSGESSEEMQLGLADDKAADDKAASGLDLIDDLDLSDSADSVGSRPSAMSGDVLSELDLLAGESIGSGLLSGDSEDLLGSSLIGEDEGGSGVDDALADDDDLIIADDDDDLVISSMGSDISIAGDSGINLMSPSDSGLSLESEPLDLAGSSISALDLGAELSDESDVDLGGLGSGLGLDVADGSDSAVDFQADEEFQLSASGVQLEGGSDGSASQIIDIEDSEAVELEDDFAEAAFEEEGGFDEQVAFDEVPVAEGEFEEESEAEPMAMDDEEPVGVDTSMTAAAAPAAVGAPVAYEVPFTILQTIGLLLILIVMSLGGMLMTDLVRNMWTHTELSAPVSSLTDLLIDVAGWGK